MEHFLDKVSKATIFSAVAWETPTTKHLVFQKSESISMGNLKYSLPQTEVVWGKCMWRQSWVCVEELTTDENLKDLNLDGKKSHKSRIYSPFTEDIMYKNTTMISKRQ